MGVEGESPSTTCTIRFLISYLVLITLSEEESRCHGTRVLTWAGRAVPNALLPTPLRALHSANGRQPRENGPTTSPGWGHQGGKARGGDECYREISGFSSSTRKVAGSESTAAGGVLTG